MSSEETKEARSRRTLKTINACVKQAKIAKAHGLQVDTVHYYAKHHAMDCGNPKCVMCGNPRKTWKEKTIQEKRADSGLRHIEFDSA